MLNVRTELSLIIVCLLVMLVVGCSNETHDLAELSSDDPDHTEIVKNDLFAVITLQGASCGKVVSYDKQNNLDYVAVCESGDLYRVHVSAEGRVNVNSHTED